MCRLQQELLLCYQRACKQHVCVCASVHVCVSSGFLFVLTLKARLKMWEPWEQRKCFQPTSTEAKNPGRLIHQRHLTSTRGPGTQVAPTIALGHPAVHWLGSEGCKLKDNDVIPSNSTTPCCICDISVTNPEKEVRHPHGASGDITVLRTQFQVNSGPNYRKRKAKI